MSPTGGPDFRHSADRRIPDRSSWRGFPLSVVWAFAPLYTCGFAAPFIIGHAAIRLRSRNLGFATGVYGAFLLTYATIASVMDDGNPATEVESPVTAAAGVWLLAGWLGGTVHALFLRPKVFRPHPRRPAPSTAWDRGHNPVPPPPYRRSTAPPAPPAPSYRVPAGPPPSSPRPSWNDMGAMPVFGSLDGIGIDRIGRYVLIRKIGEGGQGAVHLAHGPDGQPVAIKVLHDRIIGGAAERESFVKEAAMARRVRPFATARVIDVGVVEDLAYIISEYVPGPSLDRLVRDEGPRGGDSLTRLAIGTAAALNGIHAADVVHRDFKPANVLIGPDGPRVIDFGIARAVDRFTVTSGGLRGTLVYMSPEQISGDPVGPASDIFSWASTMLFGATGRHAFDGASHPHIFRMITQHRPDLSVLPGALRNPVAACLAKDPRDRPTAAEVMTAVTG
ncbi:serine/threonine-protein kinase [Streptosporangium sp. NPDC002721]|uniref:serine/threonine-protein kinase n=1 Tax=Streptosporangium sp. NPDC002721 TaxID=3366188 RepID=UPI0036CDE626